jgi:hypothetical protein
MSSSATELSADVRGDEADGDMVVAGAYTELTPSST